jgi:hypothetical protein
LHGWLFWSQESIECTDQGSLVTLCKAHARRAGRLTPATGPIRIQQNGRLTAATNAAKRRLAHLGRERPLERRCLMARTIVMPDATQLKEGIKGAILYAEQVAPEHQDDLGPFQQTLENLRSSEQLLERLERAVHGEGATA